MTPKSIPLFRNRLPTIDEAIDRVVQVVDLELGAKVHVECAIVDLNGKILTELNGLNQALENEALREAEERMCSGISSELHRSEYSLKNLFSNSYSSNALRSGSLRRKFDITIKIHNDAPVVNLSKALQMINMGLGIDLPNRLMSPSHFYVPFGMTPGMAAVKSIIKWQDDDVVKSNLRWHRFEGGEIEFRCDCASWRICEDVDFWPAYECLCEGESFHFVRWRYLNLDDAVKRIPSAEVRNRFSDNQECGSRCYWIPIIGACGIQSEDSVMMWVDDVNAFVEMKDDSMLRRFGVVYVGCTIMEGLSLLSEYIRDLRVGRKLREQFESTDANFKFKLPHDAWKRRTTEDDCGDWSDSEMADQGLRESGPCANWPDYE